MEKVKLGKFCKDKMIEETLERFKNHPDFVITSFMGSSVSDMEQLRKSLKKNSASYLVVKNSTLRIIFEKLKLKDEASKIDGGMGISFSGGDIITTCKTLVTFSKGKDKFQIKGAVIDGKSVSQDRVRQFASLPSKEVLLAQVIGGIKAPITGFVNILSGVLRSFVYVVDAIRDKKSK